MKLSEIARLVGGALEGPDDPAEGISGIEDAGPADVTFLADERYAARAASTRALAMIVSRKLEKSVAGRRRIVVDDAGAAFLKLARELTGPAEKPEPGAHATAVVSKDATLGKNVSLHAFVVVEKGASIGDGSVIFPFCYVGRGARIGHDCILHPRVTVRERVVIGDRVIVHAGTVIGTDGFGYLRIGGGIEKIPHAGTVEIEDDVEIGANCTIARARFSKTVIRKGSKIDNLCHVAHNVVIGQNVRLAAQVGIAGSSVIDRDAILAGQAGIADHIRVGEGAICGAQSGVIKDVPPGVMVSGAPARPVARLRREMATTARLHEILAAIRRDLDELKKRR